MTEIRTRTHFPRKNHGDATGDAAVHSSTVSSVFPSLPLFAPQRRRRFNSALYAPPERP